MLYFYQGGINYNEAMNMTIPELLGFMKQTNYISKQLNKKD